MNAKTKAQATPKATKSQRFGAFVRRNSLKRANSLGRLTKRVALGTAAIGKEIAEGFVEEGKSNS